MRALIYLLVLGNLLLFALASGWFTHSPADPADAAGKSALSPDRIRIVSRGDPPPVAVPPSPPSAAACLEWPDISRAQADRIAQASEASGVLIARQESAAATHTWWVSIPASPSRKAAGAEKKAAELKKLGIRKFSIIHEEGPNQYALSFGAFSSEQEAQALISRLRQKGVRSAQMTQQVAAEARERVVLHGPVDRLAAFRTLLAEAVAKDCEASPGGAKEAAMAEQSKANEAPPGAAKTGLDEAGRTGAAVEPAMDRPASDAGRRR